MAPPWTAEHILEPALAQSLLEEQFPELSPVRLAELGVGWDNTVFRVNGTHIARFPRRRVGAELLAAERRVLPRLAPRLPLAIPVPVLHGRPSRGYPWEFLLYREIPGRTACAMALDESQRRAAAPVIGHFLSELHAIDAAEAAGWGATRDAMGRLDLEHRRPEAHQRLDALVRLGRGNDVRRLRAIVDAVDGLAPRADTLVHGDLYVRHLLVDDASHVCGVIDWGDVHLGDPALDLAIAFTFLPPSARDSFFDAYGEVGAATRALARFRALIHTSILVPYALDLGDDDLLWEASASLRFLAEE